MLDSFRRIVQALRNSSKYSEKTAGLSAAQIFVLQKLEKSKKPLTINALAKATLTHQSSVSVVVSKLTNRGLIERTPSESDSRAVELKISKRGSILLRKSPPSFQETLLNGMAQMSDKEQANLSNGLQVLIQKMGIEGTEPFMLLEEE